MKRLVSALPFVAAFIFLAGSVLAAKAIHSKPSDVYPVNTVADQKGEIYTIRMFSSISSVIAIDMENHSRRKTIAADGYTYDPETTRLSLNEPLPFGNTVLHIEGTSSRPERFCLHDFAGASSDLLVLLDGREAIEGYEYSYDKANRMLVFREDIRPEHDGLFHIMYETKNGGSCGFGNWGEKDGDRLAELQGQWLARLHSTPPLVMKDRSGLSDRKLGREVGFAIQLPKGNSTFICETADGKEKKVSVMRCYDNGLTVECRAAPFPNGDGLPPGRTEEIRLGSLSVRREECVEGDARIFVYEWERDGSFYRLIAGEGTEREAEELLERM
ncbi:MAG: hypothetical protein K6G18_14140 [Treponema sp.]|nr:hypothetical protein [Treponema sp.]